MTTETFRPTHALINGNTSSHHLVQEINDSTSYTRYVDRAGKTRAFRSSGATYVGDKTQPEGDGSHYVFDRLIARDGRYYSECLGRFV